MSNFFWAQPEYYHRGQHQSNRPPGCGLQSADRPSQTLQEGNQQPNLRAQGLQPPHACEKGIAPNDWQENLGPVLQQGSLRSRGRGVQQRPESLWVQQRAPVHWEDRRQEEISEKCDLVQPVVDWWGQHQRRQEMIDWYFPKGSALGKHFNRSTVKVSYISMPNMARIISKHNKKVTGSSTHMEIRGCNRAPVGRNPARRRGSGIPPTVSLQEHCGCRWHHQAVHQTHLKHLRGEVHWTQGLLRPPQVCQQDDPLKPHLGAEGWEDHLQSTLVHPQP